ncbi:MAG: hypothetical protein KDK27_20810, partial [Leptospiraceae bacterium]|nr:hypothetical protein [Leptospiraceae bacterium]
LSANARSRVERGVEGSLGIINTESQTGEGAEKPRADLCKSPPAVKVSTEWNALVEILCK